MPIDADRAIRPYVDHEIEARSPILHDGSAGHTGVSGMVDNQATLWAESGHMLATEIPHALTYDLPAHTVFYNIGAWVVPIPQWLNDDEDVGRRYLMVFVRSEASGGSAEEDWLWRISRTDNTVLTTGGTWATVQGKVGRLFEVPLPEHVEGAPDGVAFDFVIQLSKKDVAHTLDVLSMQAWVRRSPDERNRLDYIELAGAVQADWRAPLDVYTTRCLAATNDVLYHNNVRSVAGKGFGPPLQVGSAQRMSASNSAGAIVLRDDGGPSDAYPSRHWEWTYYPRQGVRIVYVHINATTEKASERLVRFHFDGHPNDQTPHKVDQDKASYNWDQWAAGGTGLDAGRFVRVPEGPGPFRLRLTLLPSETSEAIVYVHQVHVYEGRRRAPAMGVDV